MLARIEGYDIVASVDRRGDRAPRRRASLPCKMRVIRQSGDLPASGHIGYGLTGCEDFLRIVGARAGPETGRHCSLRDVDELVERARPRCLVHDDLYGFLFRVDVVSVLI